MLPAGKYGQRSCRHSLFFGKNSQRDRLTGISTPKRSFVNSTAVSMDCRPVRLQQRGPPSSPIAASTREVHLLQRPRVSLLRGVVSVTMLMNMPALTVAPQHPPEPAGPAGDRASPLYQFFKGSVQIDVAAGAVI